MINMRLGAVPSRTYTPDANAIEGEVGFKSLWQKVTSVVQPRGFTPIPQGGKPVPVPTPGGRGYLQPQVIVPDGSVQPIGPTQPTPTVPKPSLEALHAEIRGCMADFNSSPRCRMLLNENAMCATTTHHDCIEAGLPITGGNLPGTTATIDPTGDPRTWFQKYGKLSLGAIGAGILAVGAAIFLRDN